MGRLVANLFRLLEQKQFCTVLKQNLNIASIEPEKRSKFRSLKSLHIHKVFSRLLSGDVRVFEKVAREPRVNLNFLFHERRWFRKPGFVVALNQGVTIVCMDQCAVVFKQDADLVARQLVSDSILRTEVNPLSDMHSLLSNWLFSSRFVPKASQVLVTQWTSKCGRR